jgi:hypothetical protein
MSNVGESVRLGWRVALVGAAVAVGTFPWNEAPSGLFGVVPIVIWCFLARSRKTGVTVGLILLALLVWFVVPRGLGWSGPLVPSAVEVCWLYPVIAAIVCGAALPRERSVVAGVLGLVTMVLAGFLAAAVVLFGQLEAKPGDEGVLPAPSGLRMTEGDGWCGSGNCSREVVATGDRAAEVMREHLASRGFSSRAPLGSGDERVCRATGLVFTHEVCAETKNIASDVVEVTWYVN